MIEYLRNPDNFNIIFAVSTIVLGFIGGYWRKKLRQSTKAGKVQDKAAWTLICFFTLITFMMIGLAVLG